MASDLVQRLRGIDEDKCYAHPWTVGQACNDAADRIEALERALRFYADTSNWKQNGPLDPNSPSFTGGPARALLAKDEAP